ncbi:MAG: hypothetical protein WCE98_00025 [Chlorobium sp.]|jgi:hypothetical protein|nr:hypothetical protein [Chlorobiaceae bacterium]
MIISLLMVLLIKSFFSDRFEFGSKKAARLPATINHKHMPIFKQKQKNKWGNGARIEPGEPESGQAKSKSLQENILQAFRGNGSG